MKAEVFEGFGEVVLDGFFGELEARGYFGSALAFEAGESEDLPRFFGEAVYGFGYGLAEVVEVYGVLCDGALAGDKALVVFPVLALGDLVAYVIDYAVLYGGVEVMREVSDGQGFAFFPKGEEYSLYDLFGFFVGVHFGAGYRVEPVPIPLEYLLKGALVAFSQGSNELLIGIHV